MTLKERVIGAIGLGDMGGGIAANQARAGFKVIGYDLKPEEVDRLIRAGGEAAANVQEIVARSDVIWTCVEGHDAIELADKALIPNARPGQTYIDHSTIPAPQARRIGKAFLDRGAGYLDAPISGGRGGAEAGTLRIFVGGDQGTAQSCWPLFEAAGDPDKIVYCGAIGMGQVAKVVQQLTVRWPDVARMEVMAFGLRAGLDVELVMRALDVSPDSNDPYARLYRAIESGNTDHLSGLFAEWEYFIEEARAKGFRMPMLEALYDFLKDAPKVSRDTVDRPQPSLWNELMRTTRSAEESR
jgi:3-hydroxyisobutyrate dehydrogenase-like beta-hydroxyacid dehydrogenase